MKKGPMIALLTVGIGAALAVSGGVLFKRDARAAENPYAKLGRSGQAQLVDVPQPDTSSPNWKELSADVGVMIRDDERLGLRGRLYVRVAGVWHPVATDGPADVHTTVPVK